MADIWTVLIQNLNAMGFYGFVLPWIFIFAVVYGLLIKAGIFGTVNKAVSGVIAVVIAFFGTAVAGPQLAAFFITLFGGASIYVAGILVVLLFLALVGGPTTLFGEDKKHRGKAAWAIGLLIVAIGIVLFTTATGIVVTGIELNETTVAAIFVVIVIVLAVYFLTAEEEEKTPSGRQRQPGQPQ